MRTTGSLSKIGMVLVVAMMAGMCIDGDPARAASPFSITLPEDSANFDAGLDVRDAQNRPVSSPAARAQLRQLFVNSMYRLLTTAQLPRVAEVLSVLEKAWQSSTSALQRAMGAVWAVVLYLWSPDVKRFNPSPLLLLLAVLTTGLSFRFLGFFEFQPRKASLFNLISSTVLRC